MPVSCKFRITGSLKHMRGVAGGLCWLGCDMCSTGISQFRNPGAIVISDISTVKGKPGRENPALPEAVGTSV